MNTLVISDTHLGTRFEEKKFNVLKSLISHADQVVLNGDFWEGYFITFQEFVDSKWKHLFPLLKKKKTVYLHGNHDREQMTDNKLAKLFSEIKSKRFELKIGKKTFVFEHGNRLMPFRDELNNKVPFRSRIVHFVDTVEKLLVKSFGPHHQKLFRHLNKGIKDQLKRELKRDEIYVCGHTHCAEVDEKNQFINTGIFRHGLGQYLLVNEKRFEAKEIFYG